MGNPSLKLQEIMGTYYPNFLEIYVNTDKAVVLHKLSKKELGTFFHEWIHFIQDITTSFGCYNAYVYFESFLSLGKKAMEEKDGISGSVSLDNSTNVFTNRYLLNNGWGSVANFPFSAITQCVNQSIHVPQYLVTDPSITEIPQCLVTTDAGKTFQFGALHIMESMASLCQRVLFPESEGSHPIHPYHIAEMIAELYSPEFAKNKLNIIALCDVSLMCSVPGAQFVSYLARIRNKEVPLPVCPEDIYDYYLKNHNYLPSYSEICEKARHHFKGVLKDPKAFASYRTWIDNAYDVAWDLRNNHPYFILDLLKCNNLLDASSSFSNLFFKLGTPLLRNNQNEYNKYPLNASNKSWDVEFMQPIKHIGNMLIGGKRSCALKEWCRKSEEELVKQGCSEGMPCHVDERCDMNPSLRSLDKIRCPLGFVWYALGIPLMK